MTIEQRVELLEWIVRRMIFLDAGIFMTAIVALVWCWHLENDLKRR